MAATKEQLAEAGKLALLSPNIGKHGPRKATIERALDVIFEGKRTTGFKRKALQKHDRIVDVHLDQATSKKETQDRLLYLKSVVYKENEKENAQNVYLQVNQSSEVKVESGSQGIIKQRVDEFEGKVREDLAKKDA